jgi:hypothetical protein
MRAPLARRRVGTALLAALLLTGHSARPVRAASDDGRVAMGARLFRAMLDADVDLARKTLPDGRLLVVFLHRGDATRAARLASEFTTAGKGGKALPVAGLPLAIELTNDPTFAAFDTRPPAGIFLTEALDGKTLRDVIEFGVTHKRIVYSPFDGDVERGVLGGLSIEAQVKLSVNERTMEASSVALKPLFLKSCKVYR